LIAFVAGELLESGTTAVIAASGGIGLDVQLSSRSAERLPPVGETVRLWTHLVVREDSWTLYGFADRQERTMFRLLVSVSGIGPKVALGILSGASPAKLVRYLNTGDEKSLTTLPGIGKKSAARLVVELGQRVPRDILPVADDAAAAAGTDGAAGGLGEAVRILGAMGLNPTQAEQALLRARAENVAIAEDLESWVRGALRYL